MNCSPFCSQIAKVESRYQNKITALERERDAAVNAIVNDDPCSICIHYPDDGKCQFDTECSALIDVDDSSFKWRGLQGG